jgi:hypothetical protein
MARRQDSGRAHVGLRPPPRADRRSVHEGSIPPSARRLREDAGGHEELDRAVAQVAHIVRRRPKPRARTPRDAWTNEVSASKRGSTFPSRSSASRTSRTTFYRSAPRPCATASGMPTPPTVQIVEGNGNTAALTGSVEGTLDVQIAYSMAPAAQITVFTGQSSGDADLILGNSEVPVHQAAQLLVVFGDSSRAHGRVGAALEMAGPRPTRVPALRRASLESVRHACAPGRGQLAARVTGACPEPWSSFDVNL